MNTLYTQYVNEARTQQYHQALQREAAAERALRTTRREQPAQIAWESRPSYARRLLRALAALV